MWKIFVIFCTLKLFSGNENNSMCFSIYLSRGKVFGRDKMFYIVIPQDCSHPEDSKGALDIQCL